MATRNIVPRATGEGSIGTSAKTWGAVYTEDLSVTNAITGNLTGDVTGDVTGNLTGDVTGNLTGDVTGNLTGNVTGNLTGNVTGNADTATNATNDENGNNIASTYLPIVVGAVTAFAGSTTPQGWLLCDGSAVSRTDYADLYAVIGDTYGAGDGSTTFNLPNLVDKFIEGSATSGTEHSAGLPNITGGFYIKNTGGSILNQQPTLGSPSGAFADDGVGDFNTYSVAYGASYAGATRNAIFDASLSNSIYGNSNTVQPPSVTMRYIIKY